MCEHEEIVQPIAVPLSFVFTNGLIKKKYCTDLQYKYLISSQYVENLFLNTQNAFFQHALNTDRNKTQNSKTVNKFAMLFTSLQQTI